MELYEVTIKRKFKNNPLIWKIVYCCLIILSIPFYYSFKWLKIKPDTITWLAILSRIPAIIFFLSNEFWIGMLFLILGHILDCVDGAIAHSTNNLNNKTYAYLDHMFHIVSLITLLIGVGIGSGYLVVGVTSAIFYLLSQISFRYKDNLLKTTNKKSKKVGGKQNEVIRIALSFEGYLPMIIIGKILGLMMVLNLGYLLITSLMVIYSFKNSYKAVSKIDA
ncbi:MAG: CDP-alcohol phosphatidyltransferase family protein [Candidatus Woesearchaeota archaeon]